jgi:hypothetical protein
MLALVALGPARAGAAVPQVTEVSLTMLANDVVQGVGVARARISVTPPVEGATVQVQRRSANGWEPGGTVKTHEGGLVTVKFNLDAPGPAQWRAVVTDPVAKPVTSAIRSVTIHAASAADASEFSAVAHALCNGMAEALSDAGSQVIGFAAVKAFPATECETPAFAAAAAGGITDALVTVVAAAPSDTATEPTWGPLLADALRRARSGLTGPALDRFDAWLSTNRTHVADAYAECLQAASEDQCLPRRQAADAALSV